MAPFILKFKGNKSFVAFHNMNDGDSLTKTWKVCTKVAAHLEQGQRLENLSWRLWHLHNIMVETDNAKSKRDFKKLSRSMGDKLDREKGKNIEELRAPGYKRTESSDKMRRRAEEIERLRDESHSGGGMRRMQFTFSLDTPTPSTASPQKSKITVSATPNKKPSIFKEPVFKVDSQTLVHKITDFKKSGKATAPIQPPPSSDAGKCQVQQVNPTPIAPPTVPPCPDPELPSTLPDDSADSTQGPQPSVRLPGIFSTNFGPTALLHPSPSLGTSLSYGEDVTASYTTSDVSSNDTMGISRPTIELPLDELLEVDGGDISDSWGEVLAGLEAFQSGEDRPNDSSGQSAPTEDNSIGLQVEDLKQLELDFDLAQLMQTEIPNVSSQSPAQPQTFIGPASFFSKHPPALIRQRQAQTATLNPMALHPMTSTSGTNTGSGTGNAAANSSNGNNTGSGSTDSNNTSNTNTSNGKGAPGATVAPTAAPAGQKTECSNCGATHTPLWRRGLNDELNCNACGLYCKLHKRPRPKSMRASHGENARNNNTHNRSVDNDTIGAKCFNCHTTATPLWRKDDEGKTVCNACGLYYKLHGTNRPLSMKSDVIRKRSRHELTRAGVAGSSSETPSASPGASRRASPARANSPPPEEENREEDPKTPQLSFDYTLKTSPTEYPTRKSPPNDMLSSASSRDQNDGMTGAPFPAYFPGPYHPDYLYQIMSSGTDLQPIQTGDSPGYGMEDRGNKRRRLSSASYDSSSTPTDPPPSATSTTLSSKSGRSKSPPSSPSFPSYGLPFSSFNYPMLEASSAWISGRIHPPMVLPEDAPMEYLHPPMVLPESVSLPATSLSSYPYMHPPMLPVDEAALSYMHQPVQPQGNSPIVGFVHPPMLPSYWNNDQNSSNSNENSNNTEMFESIMKSLE